MADAEAVRLLAGEQLALGRLREPQRHGDLLRRRQRAHVVERRVADAAAPTSRSATGAGAASSASPSASSRRCSGARSSNSRKTSRRRERSGACAATSAGSSSTGTSRWIVARRLDSRAASAWIVRFSLRLAPEISSIEPSTRLEVAEALEQVAGRLVADAGDAGDVVGGVALEAVEVGDALGRDAVAVDHRLPVVELGVGDAAPGRHDLDQAVRRR